MVFSSFTFLLIFLPVTILLYYLIPQDKKNLRNLVLLVMSLLFYAWGEPLYILLMLVSIVLNYLFGLAIHKFSRKKLWLVISVIFNIGLLFFYKYSDFLITNINTIFSTEIPLLELTLPIGISFYTFQIMSYVIDVYNKNVEVQRNILTLATYISLFPQLIAGPIVRYITVEEELSNRKETLDNFAEGVRGFILGLGKKVIIANNVAIMADAVFNSNPTSLGSLIVWIGAISYTLQIYFDFSGYSDMAIGLGKMFGFNFLENFDYPYISKSITEFWRRWHISLSTWFKDYVYIPLGGNRVSKVKWLRNIFIVWALTGLWHGASWNYVIWGLYFAVILVFEKIFIKKYLDKIPSVFSHIYAILLIIIGWVIFRVEDINILYKFLIRLFDFSKSDLLSFVSLNPDVITTFIYIIIGMILSVPLWNNILQRMNNSKNVLIQYTCDIIIYVILLIVIMFLLSSSYNPFIYFRF